MAFRTKKKVMSNLNEFRKISQKRKGKGKKMMRTTHEDASKTSHLRHWLKVQEVHDADLKNSPYSPHPENK